MHLTLLLCSMKLPLRKSSRIFSLIQVGKTCNELVKFMKMNENECFHRQDHRFLELSYSNIQISMSSNWWFVHMTSTMWVFNILHRRSSTPIRWIFRSLAILAIGSPWHKSKLQNHQLFLLLLLVITIVPWPELGGTAGGEWPNRWGALSQAVEQVYCGWVFQRRHPGSTLEDGKVFRWWCTRRSRDFLISQFYCSNPGRMDIYGSMILCVFWCTFAYVWALTTWHGYIYYIYILQMIHIL